MRESTSQGLGGGGYDAVEIGMSVWTRLARCPVEFRQVAEKTPVYVPPNPPFPLVTTTIPASAVSLLVCLFFL